MLVFVQKITFIRRKIDKKLLPPELLFLAQIGTKSFVGWGLIIAVFRGPLLRVRGGGREGNEGDVREGRGVPPLP